MLALSIGVSHINDTLPESVYALLSGLNAATVGVVALAAVELSHKAITDKLTRLIVFISASAGMLYNALWYFPVLMIIAGCATFIYDYRWLHKPIASLTNAFKLARGRRAVEDSIVAEEELWEIREPAPSSNNLTGERERDRVPEASQAK